MKKYLFLTNYPSPYRVNFFDELGKYADVTVLFTRSSSDVKHRSADWFQQSQGNFRAVQLKKTVSIGKENLCLEVLRWIRQPYDQVVACVYSNPTIMLAMLAMRLMGKDFWLELDGGLIREESRLKYGFKRLLITLPQRWFSSGANTTRCLIHYGADSQRIREYPFTSLYQKDLLERPVSGEEKAALRQRLDMKEEQIVLSVGQFIHRKGVDILIRAAAELPRSIGFYIVGGEAPREYQDLRRELDVPNVHFLGFRKKEDLAEFYRAADLFALPTREDIWGLVINEAMAYGLPVITTSRCVAGLDLIENGKNGYVVPVEDSAALAEGIRRILAENCRAMGAAALEKIQPYTLENMTRVHLEQLEET